MFKKKKKKQKEFKEMKLPFKKEEKKKPEIPIRIKEEGGYAVLEPFGISKQKKTSIELKPKTSKEVMQIKKKEPKEEVKPKLIIQKIKPKEIKPGRPVQKVLSKPSEKITKPEEAISKIPINSIETDIDKLMEIIDEKKIIGLEYISKALKISVERLETWAKMLEDRGLIEIEYPIIGLPKLRKKECKKE